MSIVQSCVTKDIFEVEVSAEARAASRSAVLKQSESCGHSVIRLCLVFEGQSAGFVLHSDIGVAWK